MKKSTIIWILIFGVFLILGGFAYSKYNTLVSLDEDVNKQWANVETQYQRRMDLVPNLVSVVKGYAKHEKETFESVTKARSQATSVNIDMENITPEKIEMFQKAQGELSGALSRLLATVESYPNLQANKNFLELQAQLEGTENRISVARNRFNETATIYNKNIRMFPGNLFAGWFGFEKRPVFKAEKEAQKAPKIEM